jgi:iron complex transport system permease protein
LSADAAIFWYQRVPRVLLALLAGGTLAVVGAAFQVLFRNPLVEPYTIGMSGGAALGAFLAISVPALWVNWGPFSTIQFFAMLGASASLTLIYYLARKPQGMSVYTLLLAGVTISIICGGTILFLSYLASPHVLVLYHRWMMGGIDVVGYRDLFSLGPLLIPGLFLMFYHAHDLNHISLGEEMAMGHGVDTKRVNREIFVGGGLSTAAVVSFVGPIGFVGLIIPHAVRRISGYDQRTVLPCSFLLGGAALALCDAVARSILSPTELPVGIITAIIGGPLFIRLLISRRWR